MGHIPLKTVREAVQPRSCVWATYRQIVRTFPQLRGTGAMLCAAAIHEDK